MKVDWSRDAPDAISYRCCTVGVIPVSDDTTEKVVAYVRQDAGEFALLLVEQAGKMYAAIQVLLKDPHIRSNYPLNHVDPQAMKQLREAIEGIEAAEVPENSKVPVLDAMALVVLTQLSCGDSIGRWRGRSFMDDLLRAGYIKVHESHEFKITMEGQARVGAALRGDPA